MRTEGILASVLENILLLLHPLMPFVTEEVWQVLKPGTGSVMTQPYPRLNTDWICPEAEEKMRFLTEVIRAIRNLRSEMNCAPSKEVKIILFGPEEGLALLSSHEKYLRALARAGTVNYVGSLARGWERPKGAATAVVRGMEVYLPMDETINLREEQARLTKEVGKMEEELARVQKKLGNHEFLSKAKEEVIQREKEKSERFEEKMRTLQRSLQRLLEIQ